MRQYILVLDSTPSGLSYEVSKLMEQGYIPIGGVIYHDDQGFMQAVYLPTPLITDTK